MLNITPRGAAVSVSVVETLRSCFDGKRVVVLTGAGLSTESGIPDYRSPHGSYSKGHKPVTHQEFCRSAAVRARYWARSLGGWRLFAGANPNDAHRSLARLEQLGWISHLITQNVDRLHAAAGSRRVIELHGHNDAVECLGCGMTRPRLEYQGELEAMNRAWIQQWLDLEQIDVRADGDAHIGDAEFRSFHVPGCPLCGGIVKPSVVFFGGSITRDIRERALDCVLQADRVLCIGTSLQVGSAYRLVRAAHERGKPIWCVNIGPTRADSFIAKKIECRAAELLPKVVPQLWENAIL